MSWLWDVENHNVRSPRIFTGGTRGYDMAVRLKYDDVAAETKESLDGFLTAVMDVEAGERAVLFCTYTAMLGLRKLLRAKGITIQEVGL